jgi:ABC-type transport system involved in cytochrome bd biosynthesis fused ATPase/permease subunit
MLAGVFRMRTLGLGVAVLGAWFVISNLHLVAAYLVGVEQTIGTSSLAVISAFLFALSFFFLAFALTLYVLFFFMTTSLQMIRSGLGAQLSHRPADAITELEEEMGTADKDGTSSWTPFDEKEHNLTVQLEKMRAEYGFTEDEMDEFRKRATGEENVASEEESVQ